MEADKLARLKKMCKKFKNNNYFYYKLTDDSDHDYMIILEECDVKRDRDIKRSDFEIDIDACGASIFRTVRIIDLDTLKSDIVYARTRTFLLPRTAGKNRLRRRRF